MEVDNVKKTPSTEHDIIYSPASIVSIFNANTTTPAEKRIIKIRGIFCKTGTSNYGGFFYNKLRDEASDYAMTLITSALVHTELKPDTTIEFNGFISRKINKLGQIEIHMNFIELIGQTANKYSEEDIKKIEILNLKRSEGFKDLDAQIKKYIYESKTINILVLMGKSAIIDNDIKKALGIGIALYNVFYKTISLSSLSDIADSIKANDNGNFDVICVARGGGENLEIFNKPELLTCLLNRKCIIASAIGHATDITLFEQAADKKFTTPTAFGNYLKSIFDETVEELQKSKAKLQRDIEERLKKIYDEQFKTLNSKLSATVDLNKKQVEDLQKAQKEKELLYERSTKQQKDNYEERIKISNEQINNLKGEISRMNIRMSENESSGSTVIVWIVIIVIIIILISLMNK